MNETSIARLNRLALAALAAAYSLVGAPDGARANEPALERIRERGVLIAGTREFAPPFAFRDAETGEFQGFSVDLLRAIHAELDRRIEDREIALRIVPVTGQSRIQMVRNGDVDIVCGITSITWSREQEVDFTMTFFYSGNRILTPREFANLGLQHLEDKRIGVIQNSTTEQEISRLLPSATIFGLPDMDVGMQMLERGELDGLSNVETVLRGLMNKSEMRGALTMLPRIGTLNQEPLGCIVQENDSDWRDFVNGVMLNLLDGVEEYSGGYYDIYDKWFGRASDLHFPLNQEAVTHFENIRAWIRD